MKYSPKLSLLKKEGEQGGGQKCAEIDRWRVPQMLLMSGLLRPLYRGGVVTRRSAGGPLNVHTNVPLTARQSPQQKPPISKNTTNSAAHSRYPKHAFAGTADTVGSCFSKRFLSVKNTILYFHC